MPTSRSTDTLVDGVRLPKGTSWRLGYRPGLDGVRGIAILLVLAFHSSLVPVAAVGVAGVTLFFVLSGFLITRLLVEERERGSIDLRAFYVRRARRLLPALLVMLTFTLPFTGQLWSAGWAMSYVGNWWWASGHDTGVYGYTWSLAIEEQFYLIWPTLMVIGLRYRSVLVLAIVVLMLRFIPVSQDMGNFSTLSHAPSLLLGALLAFRPVEQKISTIWLAIATEVALLAFLLVTAAGLQTGQSIVAGLGLILVVAGLSGSFTWSPLRYLGRISYGVYLWHLPVLVILGAQEGLRGPLVGVVGCMLAIAIADVSYRYVERPRPARAERSAIHLLLRGRRRGWKPTHDGFRPSLGAGARRASRDQTRPTAPDA